MEPLDLEQAIPEGVGEDQAIPVGVGEEQAIPVAELGVDDKGAIKYIQSVSQNLVGAGLAINTFGCTVAFRTESHFGTQAQFWFLTCAIAYFLVSINTAGVANAVVKRLAWLESSYVMTWVQLVYLIVYSCVLGSMFANDSEVDTTGSGKDSGDVTGSASPAVPATIAAVAILALSMYWAMRFARPKLFARIVRFYGRFSFNTVVLYVDNDPRLD